MISTSLKAKGRSVAVPIRWIPSHLMWSNYYEAMFGYLPLYWFMWNTIKVVLGTMVGDVLVCALVGYAFARLRAPGRNHPFRHRAQHDDAAGQVVLVPTYILFRYLHLLNTHLALILPSLLAGGAFFIFLFRQFFQSISPELGDAARLMAVASLGSSGGSICRFLRSALATVAIFSFFWNWNSFLWPLIVLDEEDKIHAGHRLKAFPGRPIRPNSRS